MAKRELTLTQDHLTILRHLEQTRHGRNRGVDFDNFAASVAGLFEDPFLANHIIEQLCTSGYITTQGNFRTSHQPEISLSAHAKTALKAHTQQP